MSNPVADTIPTRNVAFLPDFKLTAALDALAAGLSPLPTREKAPSIAWTDFQRRPMTEAEVKRYFRGWTDGIGIACGEASGNLEVLDFDMGGEAIYNFADLVEAELPGLFERLPMEQTPSGGFHLFYRAPAPVPGNRKLAERLVDGKPKVLIETRGQGGQVQCAPTSGYTWQAGGWDTIPTITLAEWDALIRAAKALNECVKPADVHGAEKGRKKSDGTKPGEDFNERGDILPILEKAGWNFHSQRGNKAYFTRPGKTSGISASLVEGKVFYCFSSNGAPFDADTAYAPFAVYALLEHAGDYRAAAKALTKEGYGDPKQPEPPHSDTEVEGIIVPDGQLPLVVDRAEAEILLRPDLRPEHRIFQRGPQLVRIAHMPATGTAGGITRHQGATLILQIERAGLQDTLGRYGIFKKYDRRIKAFRQIDPPKALAEAYLSRQGLWKVPVLRGIVAGPTIMPDGRIITQPGYDPVTCFYFSHNLKVSVPDAPTHADAVNAIAMIDGLLCGFPFLEETDRAVALAQIVTLLVRPSTETAPLIATTAPTRGSGKSELANVAAAIGTGRPCSALSATSDPVELEKRINTMILEGDPLVSIDNVNGMLRSDLLCQALTAPAVLARPLGVSKKSEMPNTAVWLSNGNNLTLAGDLARRAILCRLDPRCERPEERNFDFDPVARALEHRAEYVAAVLTIVKAYITAGSPDMGLKPFGSFASWCQMVRAPLVWARCADPCASREEILEDDPDAAQLRALVAAWVERFGRTPRIVKEIVKAGEEEESPLGAALEDIAGDGRGNINTRRLGKWLRGHIGRIVDGMKLTQYSSTRGMAQWKVLPEGE